MTRDGDGLFGLCGLGFVIVGECGSVSLGFCALGIPISPFSMIFLRSVFKIK